MRRVESEEMLDSDHWSAEEIASSLRSIRLANRWYGGDGTHKRLFRRVASRLPSREMEILEVASARGEVVQAAARMLMEDGISPQISLLDRSGLHLPVAADWDAKLPEPKLIKGDALEIPLADGSMDVVSCCLFLHHLSPAGVRAYLREALRVARVAVLLNDVERTRTNYILANLRRLIDPSRLSRNDGPASVRQAYTLQELRAMLIETGREFELGRWFLFRLGAILWK